MITIRKAEEADFDAIWRIFHQVVKRDDTYTYDPETTREQAHSIWMNESITKKVALGCCVICLRLLQDALR